MPKVDHWAATLHGHESLWRSIVCSLAMPTIIIMMSHDYGAFSYRVTDIP